MCYVSQARRHKDDNSKKDSLDDVHKYTPSSICVLGHVHWSSQLVCMEAAKSRTWQPRVNGAETSTIIVDKDELQSTDDSDVSYEPYLT